MFQKSVLWTALLSVGVVFSACDKDDDPNSEAIMPDGKIFHVALAVGSGSSSQTYVQNVSELETGSISFNGFGFEVPSTRTARIYASQDGRFLYNLDYGGGRVFKYAVKGAQQYQMVEETNVQHAVGTTHPRWTKVNEQHALLHHIATEHGYDENDAYTHTSVKAHLVSVELEGMGMTGNEVLPLPQSEEDLAYNQYIFRIDAPVVSGSKAYYGLAKRRYNPETGEDETAAYSRVETLVVDYPQMSNPSFISTQVDGARGATNGYRTPVAHADERGDIYQALSVPDASYDCFILRIKEGAYDESYAFNLSEVLGKQVTTNGWFYAGNGIGYVPVADLEAGALADPVWSLVRVDLYAQTAVELNVPEGLWLQQYQYSVVEDGKFYMALAPVGQQGYVYVFDVDSDSPDAFTQGAAIQTGADAYYIGIF